MPTWPGGGARIKEMRTSQKNDVTIQRVDERRYAVAVDGVVRYVGTLEECERRAIILTARNDRPAQDQALGRVSRLIR